MSRRTKRFLRHDLFLLILATAITTFFQSCGSPLSTSGVSSYSSNNTPRPGPGGSPGPGGHPDYTPPDQPTPPPSVPLGQKITEVKLERQSGTGRLQYVTFGHPFRKGDIPQNAYLFAKSGMQNVVIQSDVKTRHSDGSVRFAIITVQTDTSENKTLELYATQEAPPAMSTITAEGVLQMPSLNLSVELLGTTITAHEVLQHAVTNGLLTGYKTWLSGPLVSEFRVQKNADNDMSVTFDIRAYRDGVVRVKTVVENAFFDRSALATKSYTAKISSGSNVLLNQSVSHPPLTNWQRDFVLGADTNQIHVRRDRVYFLKTGAVPHYDTNVALSQQKIQSFSTSNYSILNCTSGSCGHVMMAMGTTGGRADIGPLPEWAVVYLLTMDPIAEKGVYIAANVAGAIPWHVKHSSSPDLPIISTDYKDLWLDYRNRSTAFPKSYDDANKTNWQIDDAHQPSTTYLAYILSGDYYFLGSLQNQATFNFFRMNPEYHDETRWTGSGGSFNGYRIFGGQVRGVSWNYRTLAQADYATPDSHPLKNYLSLSLEKNLDIYKRDYVDRYSAEPQQVIVGDNRDGFAPWQDDFFTMVLGYISFMGYEKANAIVTWKGGFTAGRFVSPDFCPFEGAAYFLKPGFAERQYTTWAAARQGVYPSGCPSNSFPANDSPMSYNGGAYAAVNSLVSVAPTSRNLAARQFLLNNLTILNKFGETPTFAIVPW